MLKKFTEKINFKIVWEAIKEALRYGLLGVVSYLLTGGVDALLGAVSLDPQTKLLIAGGITAGLRAIDKYLHELGKANNNESLVGGLTRF